MFFQFLWTLLGKMAIWPKILHLFPHNMFRRGGFTWWFWNDRLNIATNKEFYKSARPRKTCEFGLTTELQLLHLLLNPVYYIVLSWVKSCTCKPQHYVNANKGFPKWRENYVPMLKCKIAHIELCAVGLYLHTWKA